MKQCNFKGKHAIPILLSILAIISVTPVRAEEEYHIIATLQAPEPESYAKFGLSVAVSNEILVVGEYMAEVDGYIQAGKAYIFDTDGNLITAIQSSLPDDYGHFGISVDVVGDIIAVGNFKADHEDIVEAGKAHVFDSYGDHLLTLQSPDPGEKLRFGYTVVVGDEIILVSQLRGEIQGVLNAGSVHVYNAEGAYQTTLLSPSMKDNACFGNSMAASKEFILIGEFGDLRRDIEVGPGSVYMFDYDGNLVTTLTAPEPEEHACFGCSVSISEDKVVVGEFLATVNGKSRAGRAYIFDTDGNLLQTLHAPTVEENAEFGCAVAIEGELVVVGEHQGDVDSINEGKAYVFDLDGTLLATLKAPTPGIGAQFGYSVATNGEIVVVGEFKAKANGENEAGKVHVFQAGAAAFTSSGLTIDPSSVEVGGTVTISMEVANTGGKPGTHTVALKIDGEVEDEKVVTLNPDETKTLSFGVSASELGTFSVEIDGLSGSYTVTPEEPSFWERIPGFPYESIVLGLAAGIVTLWLLRRRM